MTTAGAGADVTCAERFTTGSRVNTSERGGKLTASKVPPPLALQRDFE